MGAGSSQDISQTTSQTTSQDNQIFKDSTIRQFIKMEPISDYLKKDTLLYRVQPVATNCFLKPLYDADTGKTGVYFSEKPWIPLGMVLEYQYKLNSMVLCTYQLTEDLDLTKPENKGKYGFRTINPKKYFRNGNVDYSDNNFIVPSERSSPEVKEKMTKRQRIGEKESTKVAPEENVCHIDDDMMPIYKDEHGNSISIQPLFEFSDIDYGYEIFINDTVLRKSPPLLISSQEVTPTQALLEMNKFCALSLERASSGDGPDVAVSGGATSDSDSDVDSTDEGHAVDQHSSIADIREAYQREQFLINLYKLLTNEYTNIISYKATTRPVRNILIAIKDKYLVGKKLVPANPGSLIRELYSYGFKMKTKRQAAAWLAVDKSSDPDFMKGIVISHPRVKRIHDILNVVKNSSSDTTLDSNEAANVIADLTKNENLQLDLKKRISYFHTLDNFLRMPSRAEQSLKINFLIEALKRHVVDKNQKNEIEKKQKTLFSYLQKIDIKDSERKNILFYYMFSYLTRTISLDKLKDGAKIANHMYEKSLVLRASKN